MTDWILGLLVLLTAATATVVVLTRDPARQAAVLSAYGLMLALTMVALAAPDVALSQIGVGTAAVPLIVILAVARCERAVRASQADRAGRVGRPGDSAGDDQERERS